MYYYIFFLTVRNNSNITFCSRSFYFINNTTTRNSILNSIIYSLSSCNMNIIRRCRNGCSYGIANYMPSTTSIYFNSTSISNHIKLTSNNTSSRFCSSKNDTISKVDIAFINLLSVSTEIQNVTIFNS